ncbi:MAG: hypothetical protein U5K27_14410 [Desulfotignum sp.]|nr:hypothetical protein [Desulfotignum sp.]
MDKPNCPYQHPEKLDDHAFMKTSLLQNPFEKFERKRFLYHCKDLKRIAFANTLWQKINTTQDLDRIKTLYFNSLKKYYQDLGGLPDEAALRRLLADPRRHPGSAAGNRNPGNHQHHPVRRYPGRPVQNGPAPGAAVCRRRTVPGI